jgi:hypothetical protein
MKSKGSLLAAQDGFCANTEELPLFSALLTGGGGLRSCAVPWLRRDASRGCAADLNSIGAYASRSIHLCREQRPGVD